MRRTQLHFITGKGGVGKSTVAASLARKLSDEKRGPVLLLEVQGSGRSLQLLGVENFNQFETQAVTDLNHVWAARILPRPSFKQYFSLLLAMGNSDSAFANLTSGLREKLVDSIFNNKVVSAFIDVCPGLEPAALLGKVHWECTEGLTPETNIPWKHVIVDAPSTGHSLMLFRSTQALVQVFGKGLVFKQSQAIMDFVKDPHHSHIKIVTLPEELPIKEAEELDHAFRELKLPPVQFIVNRAKYPWVPADKQVEKVDPRGEKNSWGYQIQVEKERISEELSLVEEFKTRVDPSRVVSEIPELTSFPTDLDKVAECFPKEGH